MSLFSGWLLALEHWSSVPSAPGSQTCRLESPSVLPWLSGLELHHPGLSWISSLQIAGHGTSQLPNHRNQFLIINFLLRVFPVNSVSLENPNTPYFIPLECLSPSSSFKALIRFSFFIKTLLASSSFFWAHFYLHPLLRIHDSGYPLVVPIILCPVWWLLVSPMMNLDSSVLVRLWSDHISWPEWVKKDSINFLISFSAQGSPKEPWVKGSRARDLLGMCSWGNQSGNRGIRAEKRKTYTRV